MKKYRLTAVLLAAALLIPSLAACSVKKGQIEIGETSTEATITTKKAEETTTKAVEESTTETITTTVAPTTAAPTTAAPTTAAPTTAAPTTAAPTTAAPTTAAPTTAAPTTEPPTAAPTTAAPKKAPTAKEIAGAVAAKQSLFDEALMESSPSRGLSLFGIDSGAVADASYYAATAAVADEILVVKLASGASADAIRSDFTARQEIQAEDYEEYVPSEVPKINNAVIYQNGDILVFCGSKDASAVRSTLDSLF